MFEMSLKHNDLSLTGRVRRCRILTTNNTRAKVHAEAQRDWNNEDMQNVNANIIIASIIR